MERLPLPKPRCMLYMLATQHNRSIAYMMNIRLHNALWTYISTHNFSWPDIGICRANRKNAFDRHTRQLLLPRKKITYACLGHQTRHIIVILRIKKTTLLDYKRLKRKRKESMLGKRKSSLEMTYAMQCREWERVSRFRTDETNSRCCVTDTESNSSLKKKSKLISS